MSDTKWTPEPWQTFEATIGVAIQVGEDEWEPMQIGSFARGEDAERSKRCVNYCAGVSGELLDPSKAPTLKELMAAYPDPEEVPRLEARVTAIQDSPPIRRRS